jgi:SNF2 family DNA or RNA helicase
MVKNLYIEKIKEIDGKITFNEIQNKFPYLCLAIDNPSLLKDRIKEEDKTLFKPLETLLKNWVLEDNVKINYLDEFLKDKIKTQKEKVIVFDTHPLTLDEMFIHYKEYNPLMIHGRTGDSMESRQDKVDKFNDKYSDHKLFLLNIQTGGTGLNLQKACNTIVFLNLPWDTTLLRQGMDRTYRVTSEKDSFVEILTYGKTIDDQRCGKSLRRIEFNDNILKDDLDLEVIIN